MQENIRIGTLVPANNNTISYIKQILPHGFESFSLTFWQQTGDIQLDKLASEVRDALANSGAIISSICVYGNPLGYNEFDQITRDTWIKLVDAASSFGCDVVCGFAGRVKDKHIDESFPRYAEVFGPIGKHAADKGVRLAFENCDMGGNWSSGDWNIATSPTAWDRMFNDIPSENIGLQWEPCHQMVKLIDPIPQLRKYVKKVFHVHGKDATVMHDVIAEHGILGSHEFAYHRTPGFGDSNWTDIITILRMNEFKGCIDIEGWHDPVYRDELEMQGQVHGLNYLKSCRGGSFVANPKV